MIILSHRGYWKSVEEKNAMSAFVRSFSNGFGTETDFRDRGGELVISHDPAQSTSMLADEFFLTYKQSGLNLPLAINIKSDGLQKILRTSLSRHGINNYFVFDMSVPDMIGYLREGLRVFTRQSEYEQQPSLYEQSQGVWIDGFTSDWVNQATIELHLKNQKKVCLVSPDLHGRNYLELWANLAKMPCIASENVMLCTDYPEEAKRFFYE